MTTTTLTITDAAYILVATGPCFIEGREQGHWRIHCGASAPAVDTADYMHMAYDRDSFTYSGSESVYMRSEEPSADIIVTPIV